MFLAEQEPGWTQEEDSLQLFPVQRMCGVHLMAWDHVMTPDQTMADVKVLYFAVSSQCCVVMGARMVTQYQHHEIIDHNILLLSHFM